MSTYAERRAARRRYQREHLAAQPAYDAMPIGTTVTFAGVTYTKWSSTAMGWSLIDHEGDQCICLAPPPGGLRYVRRPRDVGRPRPGDGRHAMSDKPKDLPTEPVYCRAGSDGDCYWKLCPQERDGEPEKSHRHCPLDTRGDDDEI